MTETMTFWERFRAAQSEMRDPVKDADNPHFRSRFVSLKGVMDAVRPALHKHGLCIAQTLDGATVVTMLRDAAGNGVESRIPVICAKQNDPQAFGSALTYARRYAIAAICGVAPADEDDDGEGANGRPTPPPQTAPKPASKVEKPQGYDLVEHALDAIDAAANELTLAVVAKRVKLSEFQGSDLERVRAAYDAKKKELKPNA